VEKLTPHREPPGKLNGQTNVAKKREAAVADGLPRDVPSMPTADAEPVRMPQPDCDLLRGIDGIAKWLGWTRGQVRAAIDCGELPSFRSRGAVFAFKSSILETFREIARRPGACAKAARKRKATAEDPA
jgi:hypothetical protein